MLSKRTTSQAERTEARARTAAAETLTDAALAARLKTIAEEPRRFGRKDRDSFLNEAARRLYSERFIRG